MVYLDDERVVVTFDLPWQEVVTDFYNELKTVSSGYGMAKTNVLGFETVSSTFHL
jgi:GTP-binding protein LepA